MSELKNIIKQSKNALDAENRSRLDLENEYNKKYADKAIDIDTIHKRVSENMHHPTDLSQIKRIRPMELENIMASQTPHADLTDLMMKMRSKSLGYDKDLRDTNEHAKEGLEKAQTPSDQYKKLTSQDYIIKDSNGNNTTVRKAQEIPKTQAAKLLRQNKLFTSPTQAILENLIQPAYDYVKDQFSDEEFEKRRQQRFKELSDKLREG